MAMFQWDDVEQLSFEDSDRFEEVGPTLNEEVSMNFTCFFLTRSVLAGLYMFVDLRAGVCGHQLARLEEAEFGRPTLGCRRHSHCSSRRNRRRQRLNGSSTQSGQEGHG